MILFPTNFAVSTLAVAQAYRRALSAEKAFLGCMNDITVQLLFDTSILGGHLLTSHQSA